tara:strand:+ start:665 stop:1090 length:426 start_codon:yes stop_codon:yes gene_type:complete
MADENWKELSEQKNRAVDAKTFKFLPSEPFKNLKLLVVVLLHHAVVIGNFSAFFILAFQGFTPYGFPWYVALPLCSFIVLVSFSKVLDCPMTRYENKLRREVGKQEIRGFMKHYMFRPYARFRYKLKKAKKAREAKKSTDS